MADINDESDDQRCMRIVEGIECAKQVGRGGQLIKDMEWLINRAAKRNTAITKAAEAKRAACEEIARTYEDWCGNWGEIRNEIAARECAKEIAEAIKALAEKPVAAGGGGDG